MYFLNGERFYIKPENACGTTDEQLQNCLLQLTRVNSGKQIFKLNFFVDSNSGDEYKKLRTTIRLRVEKLFSDRIIQNLIAQPPLTCKIVVEAFLFDPALWNVGYISNNEGEAALFTGNQTGILVGNVQSDLRAGCRNNSEKAFSGLLDIFNEADFPLNSIVRKWNYLEDILGFDNDKQHYQEFNDVRSAYYADEFEEKGYPAATGIGMNCGGLILEFIAVKSDEAVTCRVDNPQQVSAHRYSKKVLVGEECGIKTTPKFERARYLRLLDKKLIFISGTASIIGEKTVGVGNAGKQTEITIENIRQLYSNEVLSSVSDEKLQPKYGHARVYVKNRSDFATIKNTFKTHFGNLPVVYIIADICRNDLLVEIEGKVILE